MKNHRCSFFNLVLKSLFVLVLSLLAGGQLCLQAKAQSEPCPSPVPPPKIPANPLLIGHTNFFCPVKVYDLKNDAHSKDHFPTGLHYEAYSAVGFDLANSIM